MTLSGLWTRKSSPKESKPPLSPPSDVRENPWTQLKSKLRPGRGHETADRTTSPDAKVSAKTPTHHRKRDLLFQIISRRPSVHPPRPSTASSPSRGTLLSPASAVSSSSYPQVSQASPFALLSQCELSVAPTGAGLFGVVPSTDCHARVIGSEDNAGEPVEARPSQQFPTVPSANTEIPPLRELGPAFAPESSNASPQYGSELASEYLSAGSICQARRYRLRAQIKRARLIALDLADSDFPLENLNVLDLAISAEAGPVALDGYESASESSPAAAPVPSDNGLNEASSESVVHMAPADVQVTTQPPELHEPAETSRDSVASSSSSHSLFEYDCITADPPSDAENPTPTLNSAEDTDIGSERSLYDPVLQCFYLPPRVNKVGSAENDARNIDKERIESAGVKERSLTADAPAPFTHVSRSENCKLVITVTPPTPPATMRPSRDQAINGGMTHPDDSHLVLLNPRPSKSSRRSEHAGFASAMPSTPRLADHHSPPLTIDRDEDFRVGLQHQTQILPSNDMFTSSVARGNTLFNEMIPGDLLLDYSLSMQRPVAFTVVRFLLTSTLFKPHHSQAVQAFGSSVTLVDQFPPLATTELSRTSGSLGDHFRVVDGKDLSAGDEAEPSPFDAPILSIPSPRQKPRNAKGLGGRTFRSRFHRHARTLKSCIASSLREWGNAASSLFTANRPANVGETQTFSPSFDPWEQGYIPPRGPSPDPVKPGVDFGPPQPSIQNFYVKLD